ncbi:MAG: hypothetical protein LBK25_02200 [Treponema sp.]|nr:hypothetical protein [Treponema sp.]
MSKGKTRRAAVPEARGRGRGAGVWHFRRCLAPQRPHTKPPHNAPRTKLARSRWCQTPQRPHTKPSCLTPQRLFSESS